jgi:hypothetical protein
MDIDEQLQNILHHQESVQAEEKDLSEINLIILYYTEYSFLSIIRFMTKAKERQRTIIFVKRLLCN